MGTKNRGLGKINSQYTLGVFNIWNSLTGLTIEVVYLPHLFPDLAMAWVKAEIFRLPVLMGQSPGIGAAKKCFGKETLAIVFNPIIFQAQLQSA
jgi:hypothetical protein